MTYNYILLNILFNTIYLFCNLYFVFYTNIHKVIKNIRNKFSCFIPKVIINLPFFILLLLFCFYIKNPLLHSIFTYSQLDLKDIILIFILNVLLIKIFKNFFLFFELNKNIFLFSLKIYQFFTYHPITLYKCLYSGICLRYSQHLIVMLSNSDNYVQPALWSFMGQAHREVDAAFQERLRAYLICGAMPDQNNQWYLIFDEHKRRYGARQAFWMEEYRKAWNASQNLTQNIAAAHAAGRDLHIPLESINLVV